MSFKIICPHCRKLITDKDFLESEQAIAHLQQFFNSQETKYQQQLTAKMKTTWEADQKNVLNEKLSNKELEINKEKQKEIDNVKEQYQKIIDGLNSKIQNLTTQQETNNLQLKEKLSNKELEINKEKQKEIDNVKEQYQKIIDGLNSKIQNLTTQQETNNLQLKEKLSNKELEINKEKQKEIDDLKSTISELTLKLAQGRNIKSGILGSNLENDFERIMNTVYLNDNFEKTTKVINNRKPDFMLTISNPRHEKTSIGKILFELKNQEKLVITAVEDKLANELKEWNANFGLIIWTAAPAPFMHSKNYDNIFIINTDFEILTLIVNVLKLLINKQYSLTNQVAINNADEKLIEKFKIWIKDDFNKLIGKAMQEFKKFEADITKLQNINEDLTKIKNNLKKIVIEKIENKLKVFNS